MMRGGGEEEAKRTVEIVMVSTEKGQTWVRWGKSASHNPAKGRSAVYRFSESHRHTRLVSCQGILIAPSFAE